MGFKGVQGMLQGVSRVFKALPRDFRSVLGVFLGLNWPSREWGFQGCFNEFRGELEGLSRKFHVFQCFSRFQVI